MASLKGRAHTALSTLLGSLLARVLVLLSKSGIHLFFGCLSRTSLVPGPGNEGTAFKEFTVWETGLFLCQLNLPRQRGALPRGRGCFLPLLQPTRPAVVTSWSLLGEFMLLIVASIVHRG